MTQYTDNDVMALDRCVEQAIARCKAGVSSGFSLDQARQLSDCALEAAAEIGIPVVISVVDRSAYQRCFLAMDDALLISHSLAYHKAKTAAALKMTTEAVWLQAQPGGCLFSLASDPEICCIAGGVPCWSQGTFLGALGISGGTAHQDCTIAHDALQRFSQRYFLMTTSS